MTTSPPEDLAGDLAYVRQVAESGRTAALLSGRFSLIWGGLATVALIVHWAVLAGFLGWPESSLGILWAGYGVAGFVLSFIAGKMMGPKPGSHSVGNIASNAAWTAATAAIFVFAAGVVVREVIRADGGEPNSAAFDSIVPLVFACYALSFMVTARLAKRGWIYALGFISLGAVFVSTLLVGRPELYLFTAVVVFTVAVIPGIVQLRAEPAASA